jgi:methylphosphotriester-DNA--protein-cysteine methyltransferase
MGLISHAKIFLLLHQLACFSLFVWTIWYELRERLPAPENDTLGDLTPESQDVIDRLWVNITRVLIEQQGWRNPELSLQSLSEELASNRTYIGEAFKKHAGCTFSEYVVKRRIEYVVSEFKHNPHVSLQRTFSQAGFRERSTAYRNFYKIMGVTPTEYIENLKSQNSLNP